MYIVISEMLVTIRAAKRFFFVVENYRLEEIGHLLKSERWSAYLVSSEPFTFIHLFPVERSPSPLYGVFTDPRY